MCDERAFDLGVTEPVARDIDDIVDATGDPVIAVFVAAATISCKILAGIGLEVCVDEPLMVAVHRAHLSRPRVGNARLPPVAPCRTLPSASTITGCTPKKGCVAEPGLSLIAPGSGVMRMPPVSVCHHVSTIGQRPSPTTR